MKTKIQEITIPARANAPATTLRLRLVYIDEKDLSSKPYLFMLPGGPGSNHSYYSNYDCLHCDANLVYYDPRGCGLSDKGTPSSYTMDNYIDDLYIIKEKMQLDRIMLLGKSYGAMCALGYALRYPLDVSTLIMAAGAYSHAFLKTSQANVLLRGNTEQKKFFRILWRGGFQNDDQMALYFKTMASLYSWKIRNHQLTERPQTTHPFSFQALNEGFKNKLWKFDFKEGLKDINIPTLILVGEEDWVTDAKYSLEMAKRIPNSQIQVFKNADHALELDVPSLYFNAISQFIRGRI